MLLFYHLRQMTPEVCVTRSQLANFGKLSLERNAKCFRPLSPLFFAAVLRHVTDAANREVPCITMGLCIAKCYKCEAPINKRKRGDGPCSTL
jgi:hypothetical protein